MKPSIRTFLLINLLLSVTLITSLAIIGNLYLAHKDIQVQLDLDLIHVTNRMSALFTSEHNPKELAIIQKRLNREPEANKNTRCRKHHCRFDSAATDRYIAFQVWSNDGNLLLHSKDAPITPFSNGENGLSSKLIHDTYWRVNTYYDKKSQLTYIVAEQANYREQLENQLTQDSILIMLITYPFLGFLIWIIVGRGLDSLKRIAKEVDERAPTKLHPVDTEAIPTEIDPVIRALNRLLERLYDAFTREKRFAADAAHELRTPMASLNAHAQAALRSSDPEEQKQALLKIVGGVNRATHIIQQLLTLSRMVPDASINDPAVMNLAREVSEVAAQLAIQAIDKDSELELIQDDSIEPLIYGNPTAIAILARNLIDNAIRYSPNGSHIAIHVVVQEDTVTLKVIDNGPGIPEHLRQRVFERFFRVLGTQETGSGLGLGIVFQIAKLHEASIELLTPESGVGLEFQVIFKRYKA